MVIFIIAVLFFGAIELLLVLFGGTDLHFHRKADEGRTRVACVGDSITNGALLPNCFSNAYPARLQKMLGDSFQVENFGLNDRTAQNEGNKPYRREKEYRKSLAFQADIVILLLGSNDTKPVNWVSEEAFLSEYHSLVDSYLAGRKKPKIILCTPPWGMAPANALQSITNDIDASRLPQAAHAVRTEAEDRSFPVIDLYPLFEGRRELLSIDRLHPSRSGADLIACQVYDRIRTML